LLDGSPNFSGFPPIDLLACVKYGFIFSIITLFF
jgi:hypothetical protein